MGTRVPVGTLGLVHAPTVVLIRETLNMWDRRGVRAGRQEGERRQPIGIAAFVDRRQTAILPLCPTSKVVPPDLRRVVGCVRQVDLRHRREQGGVEPGGTDAMDPTEVENIYSGAFGEHIRPDRWQKRFAMEAWPEVLIAPTGSGKTAGVTLGWAIHRVRDQRTTPRRLVWCLPMRTLVEQTADVVKNWFDRLHRSGLADERLPKPEDIHVLMGGVEAAKWLDHVERPAVIVGTQDMLLSRSLMRGYASSRAIWPMEFALLHEDTQWVFDEVQLMGSGRATSAQLEAFRRLEAERAAEDSWATRCPARSLWISATLDPSWLTTVDFSAPTGEAVRRVDPHTASDGRLRRLVSAKKTLSRAEAVPASPKSADVKAYIEQLADEILDAHRPGSMTLVIVNRVQRAQDLRIALRKKQKAGASPELALVHGRFRLADRQREMAKVIARDEGEGSFDLIVVATQAVEAGVDISAAVLFTELAPWPAMVQRFGRANRYAKVDGGADVRWIDTLATAEDGKPAQDLSLPYSVDDLKQARDHLQTLADVAPVNLPAPGKVDPPRRVIRRKDLDDLFDTDPDLTGFDVDISPYVRNADDTDVRVFWRDLSDVADDPPRPCAEELCAVPIGIAKVWLREIGKQGNARVFYRDTQWRRAHGRRGTDPLGWTRLTQDPWPGLTLLAGVAAGGYRPDLGFTSNPKDVPDAITPPTEPPDVGGESEGHDEDPRSEIGVPVGLSAHLGHAAAEADALCNALDVDPGTRAVIVRAARWHDVGKAHDVFQSSMRRGLGDCEIKNGVLLAKTVRANMRHERAYFRHELASALALLSHEGWSREADLIAYLVAAHHGKVRMNLRPLPRERAPSEPDRAGDRFARGVWDNDELCPVDLGSEKWTGGSLRLAIMEIGWDDITHESWTERTRELLSRWGPFRLAWMETLVRLADWRASGKERKRLYDDS